jgi:sporulation integral membrane protein YlbJ
MSKRAGAVKMLPLWAAVFLLFFLMMTRQDVCVKLIEKGLFLTSSKVLPAVFPYMVLTSVLSKTGLLSLFCTKRTERLAALFALPGAALPAIIMGLLAGFPTGALLTAEIYRQGRITKRQAERLAVLCNFCAPPFLLGAFGQGVMGNWRFGLLLWGMQTLLLGLYGFFSSRKEGGTKKVCAPQSERTNESAKENGEGSLVSLIGSSIAEGAVKSVKVTGYVLFFSLVSGILGSFFQRLFSENQVAAALFYGFFEFSSGIACLSQANALSLFVGGLIIGWSGLSVHLQVAGFLSDAHLSVKKHLTAHLLLPPVTSLLTVLLSKALGLL